MSQYADLCERLGSVESLEPSKNEIAASDRDAMLKARAAITKLERERDEFRVMWQSHVLRGDRLLAERDAALKRVGELEAALLEEEALRNLDTTLARENAELRTRCEALEAALVKVRAELRGAGPSCSRAFAEVAMQSAWRIAGEAIAAREVPQ